MFDHYFIEIDNISITIPIIVTNADYFEIDKNIQLYININNVVYYEKVVKQTNIVIIMHMLGIYYFKFKIWDKMKLYHTMAAEYGNNMSMNYLGCYYENEKDYHNMMKYYLMAIKSKNAIAMRNLAGYYENNNKDYELMEKYYLMAIECGDNVAMNNLAYHYENKKDYINMEKYYLMAISYKNTVAMRNLAYHYDIKKCLEIYAICCCYCSTYIDIINYFDERYNSLCNIVNYFVNCKDICTIVCKY
jgi:hypothetical protein